MSIGKHRIALVTGGLGGIGRAIADRLASDGCRVFITSRTARPGVITPGIELVTLDTGDPVSVLACVQAVINKAGRIDILVNSIGNGMIGAAEEISEQEARVVVEDIFWSAARMIQAVLPGMREQGGGRILTMSSLGGRIGFPFSAFYSAGKFALEGLCEGLHLEVQQFGIGVSLIEAAGVNTPVAGKVPLAAKILPAYGNIRHTLARDVERMMRKGLAPNRIAEVVARSLDDPSPRLRYVVGAPARMTIFFLRLAPERLVTFAVRKMNKLPSRRPASSPTNSLSR